MNQAIISCKSCFVTSKFPDANFNDNGQCQWCRSSLEEKKAIKEERINYSELMAVADRIKKERTGKYDCIIGVSGGLDSSYMAYIAGKVMGLNALLVHYDHGFYYDLPKINLKALAENLGMDLRIYRSKKAWDKHFVRAFTKAFSKSQLYWGICSFCHYILPAVIVKVGRSEEINYYISHTNKYELSVKVPRQIKLNAIIRSIFSSGIQHIPMMLLSLILAQYYLLRLKLEYYSPPITNIVRLAPRKPFKTVNITKFVPWNIEQMKADLVRNTDWRMPEHPSLGMRFDCMIEDSLMNYSYKRVTGSTVHEIIANSLIYDGVSKKDELQPIIHYYDHVINESIDGVNQRINEENITNI